MKNLKEAYKTLKEIFPEAIDVGSENIEQPGLYLLLNSLKKESIAIDRVSFKLYLAARNLNDDNLGLIDKLDEIRLRAVKQIKNLKDDLSQSLEFLGFKDSLYIYVFEIDFKIFRSEKK